MNFVKDLVSIITPTYNSSNYIGETIESIISQTYSNWELIITDDCSHDDTVDIVNLYAEKDSRIKLLQLTENLGAGIARNTSIKYSKGQYIAFCDSDDLWIKTKLEKQLDFLKTKNIYFTYSSYHIISETGAHIRSKIVPEKINYTSSLFENHIGCLTVLYDQEKLGKRYMNKIKKRQDYLHWLKILKEIRHTKGIKEPLALYRNHNNSISENKLSLISYNFKVYRLLNFNSLTSGGLLLMFLFKYLYTKVKVYTIR